jgi:hypothetical protein
LTGDGSGRNVLLPLLFRQLLPALSSPFSDSFLGKRKSSTFVIELLLLLLRAADEFGLNKVEEEAAERGEWKIYALSDIECHDRREGDRSIVECLLGIVVDLAWSFRKFIPLL